MAMVRQELYIFKGGKIKVKKTNAALINDSLLVLSFSAYYLYALFDKAWIGYIFVGSLVPFLFIKYIYVNRILQRKHVILNDLLITVLTSLLFAIIGITTKLFTLSYSSNAIFNLLFIICITIIIYFDLFITKEE